MNAPSLFVASTLAIDRLFDQDGRIIQEQSGGPCLFIRRVLERENIPFTALTPSEPARVDIRIQSGEEIGSVVYVPTFPIDWKTILAPNLLISTIQDEISLEGVEEYSGRLFMDVQGFVRLLKQQGLKWRLSDSLKQQVFCLKATEDECRFIDPAFIEEQKTRLLLMTRGAKGVMYWVSGMRFEVAPKEVIRTSDTLGAGDTFFAYVVAGILRGQPIKKVVQEAVQKTSDFLTSKSHHTTPL